jgi:hypothetical protein
MIRARERSEFSRTHDQHANQAAKHCRQLRWVIQPTVTGTCAFRAGTVSSDAAQITREIDVRVARAAMKVTSIIAHWS